MEAAGNQFPEHRYAGYEGHKIPENSNELQQEAYRQGVNARECP